MANDDGSELVVPLRHQGRADGFVCVVTLGLRVFAPTEIEALQMLANQTGGRAREHAPLPPGGGAGRARRPHGLYNHRYFYERLEQECARASRYGLPLSLLMIDIDDFKQFNDRYGHLQGDQVLREVAEHPARRHRRGIDLPARYGGEEFAVILPHTAAPGAGVVGDRLQRQIAALHDLAVRGGGRPRRDPACRATAPCRWASGCVTTSRSTPPGRRQHATLAVTVSIGVAAGHGQRSASDELVRRADEALYVAKRGGKNRVALVS